MIEVTPESLEQTITTMSERLHPSWTDSLILALARYALREHKRVVELEWMRDEDA